MTDENITLADASDAVEFHSFYTYEDECPYDDYDQMSDARLDPDELSEGQIVAYETSPHGDDIPQNGVVRITKVDRSIYDCYQDLGPYIMADIRFEDKYGTSYTFMLDNRYVSGPHSGLGRRSDIAKGMKFYPIEDFIDE